MKPLLFSILLAATAAMAQTTNPPPSTNAAAVKTPPSTNAPVKAVPAAAANSAPKTVEFSNFKIIANRNIFNASRSGDVRGTRSTRRAVRVDSFKLLGTLSYEKGRFAFFNGTSADYKKSLNPGNSIENFKLMDIGPQSVKLLTTNNQVIELKVGMGMRRQDYGPWTVAGSSDLVQSTPTASNNSTESASTPAPAAAGGAENDVLKRLMQKRAQELSK